MAGRIHQYAVGKEQLYFFYRFVVLPWELEWSNQKFLMAEGNLGKYCQEHGISLKSFGSADKLSKAISAEYKTLEKTATGIFWFVRNDTKPKDTLRHLRNCFAHGNFKKRQKNRIACIAIENIDKGKTKAVGYLPIGSLEDLVRAVLSCGV